MQLDKYFARVVRNNDGFSPSSMMDANIELLSSPNHLLFKAVSGLVEQGKFKHYNDALSWLLPQINRAFIVHHSEAENPMIDKHKELFKKMNVHVCNYASAVTRPKNIPTNTDLNGYLTKYLSDTVLMKEYTSTFYLLEEKQRPQFFMGLLHYAQANCESYFNMSIKLVLSEIPGMFKTRIEDYHNSTLIERSSSLMLRNKLDSLKTVFPQFEGSKEALQQVGKIYRSYTIKTNMQIVFEDKNLQRISSYLVSILPNRTAKILCQIVFEKGLDKPRCYLKSLKFYQREKLQGIEKREAEIRKFALPSFYDVE